MEYPASRKNAFVERHHIDPIGIGALDGRRFAVKDLLAIQGKVTGSGNPTWAATHPPASEHAEAVMRLLKAGGTCVGRTITDELGFSLLGENEHHGTPLNPRAPDRVPGGSSSGSASAVAQGDVDLALGTDTGGSVRVPASNCGIFGYRPTHGRISTTGLHPFAPSFDTVGLLAPTAELLETGGHVLLGEPESFDSSQTSLRMLVDSFEEADPEVRSRVGAAVSGLEHQTGHDIQPITLAELGVSIPLREFHQHYCVVQWSEIWSSLGAWIEEHDPHFGAGVAASMELARTLDPRRIEPAMRRHAEIFESLGGLPEDMVLIAPTTPTLAPPLGMNPRRDGANADFYPRTLSQTAIAGLAGLPEISLPINKREPVPLGMSIIGARGCDTRLLNAARRIDESLGELFDDELG